MLIFHTYVYEHETITISIHYLEYIYIYKTVEYVLIYWVQNNHMAINVFIPNIISELQ